MVVNESILNLKGIPRNMSRISMKLENVQSRISKEIGEAGEMRKPQGQFVVIKTCGTPDLLKRSLIHQIDEIEHSKSNLPIRLGVLDDSAKKIDRERNMEIIRECMTLSNMNIEYMSTKEAILLQRMRNELIAQANRDNLTPIQQKELLLAFQYLLTDRFFITSLDTSPEKSEEAYLQEKYAKLGGGMASTSNSMILMGAYLMGREQSTSDRSIFTFNDDDVIPATLNLREDGLPEVDHYDFFTEREMQFQDPKRVVVAGKYVGTPGNPFTILNSALEVANGIILNANLFTPDSYSPYYLLDKATGEFKRVTVKEAMDRLPEIIQSFLVRAPITALRMPGPMGKKWIFDQGNLSMMADFSRQTPFPVGAITEFVYTGIIQSLFQGEELNRKLANEESILHLRTDKAAVNDIYETGGLLAGMTSPYVHDQAIIETLLHHHAEALDPYLKNAFGIDSLTLLSKMPPLALVQGDMVETITTLRDHLRVRMRGLSTTYGHDHPLVEALKKLTEEVSEANMKNLIENRKHPEPGSEEVKNGLKYVIRFLKAVSYWPRIFDAAYNIGKNDAIGN